MIELLLLIYNQQNQIQKLLNCVEGLTTLAERQARQIRKVEAELGEINDDLNFLFEDQYLEH